MGEVGGARFILDIGAKCLWGRYSSARNQLFGKEYAAIYFVCNGFPLSGVDFRDYYIKYIYTSGTRIPFFHWVCTEYLYFNNQLQRVH